MSTGKIIFLLFLLFIFRKELVAALSHRAPDVGEYNLNNIFLIKTAQMYRHRVSVFVCTSFS